MTADTTYTTNSTTYPIVILADGVPRKSAPVYTEEKIPGGDLVVLDIAGPSLRVLNLSLQFLVQDDALAFEDVEGTIGTLVSFDGTYDVFVADIQRTSRGVNSDGPTVLAIEFHLL